MKLPLWRRRQDEELDEEIATHLRTAIADRIARGEDPDAAARAARLEFGNVGIVRETTRDAWGWIALEQLLQDVRYACRTLWKTPGFTSVAVVTLALGIGANTAMFSVINAVLLRPLPFPSPDRLVAVSETDRVRAPGAVATRSASWPNVFDWRKRSQAFDHLSAFRETGFTLTQGSVVEHVPGAVVSSEFFSTLGVQPVLGRGFRPEEERAGGDVVVISDALWRSRFGAAFDAIGQAMTLNARPFTIVGVMPVSFHFPITVPAAQFWMTVAEDARVEVADDSPLTMERGAHMLTVIGRLRPSATVASAQADLDTIAGAIGGEFPHEKNHGARVRSQLDVLVGDTRQSLFVLLAAVVCVLLIACVNIANLLLARGAGRTREIALRAALGASSRRIVRQLLTESLVLTTAGTACGLALAYGSIAALVRLSPVDLHGLDQVTLDGAVLAFTAGIAAVSALVFGIVPALQAARIGFELEGPQPAPGERLSARFGMASPGYFKAMRIPLVRGRDFSERDNEPSPRVVIVNDSFARRYFPDSDPIGKRIKLSLSTTEPVDPWREVIGVTADIKHRSLDEENQPAYFIPYSQGLIAPLAIVVRAADTRAVVEEIRKTIARKDPELAVYNVRTLEEYLATSVATPRFQTLLLALFAAVGLLLTAVGLYGVMAHGVAQRTREFGIRLALGARPGEVLTLVLRGGLSLIVSGLAAGIAAGRFATRLLASALYGVDPLDPATFAGVAALLLAVGMLASYVPARRATRVDPSSVLRAE